MAGGVLWRFGGSPSREGEGIAATNRSQSEIRPIRKDSQTNALSKNPKSAEPGARVSTPPANSFLAQLTLAMEAIKTEPDTMRRDAALNALAKGIAIEDLPAALKYLNGRESSKLNRELMLRLARRWTEANPRAASDWVVQNAAGAMRQDAINGVAIVWASQNLTEAVEWARTLPAEDRQGGLASIAYETARTHPMEAMKLAIEMAPGAGRDELVAHTANQWASSAPKEAGDWASKIPDVAVRELVLSGIATVWGQTDPALAASLALKSISPGKAQDDAVIGIVQRWAQEKPLEAASWVTQFPEGSLRETALENLLSLWVDDKPEEAGNWLNSLPAGESRDIAAGAYAVKIAASSPEAAARWAEDIGQESLRQSRMEIVGETWMGIDDVAARAWITQSPLSDTVKARLLARQPEKSP